MKLIDLQLDLLGAVPSLSIGHLDGREHHTEALKLISQNGIPVTKWHGHHPIKETYTTLGPRAYYEVWHDYPLVETLPNKQRMDIVFTWNGRDMHGLSCKQQNSGGSVDDKFITELWTMERLVENGILSSGTLVLGGQKACEARVAQAVEYANQKHGLHVTRSYDELDAHIKGLRK
jgi:hypothetical protein